MANAHGSTGVPVRSRARISGLLALALLAGAGLYYTVDASEQRHLRTEFVALARRDVDAVSAAIEVVENRLLALGQLYASSREVESNEFTTFVSGMPSLTGITAYEWLPRVGIGDRAAHEAAAASDGLPGYAIREQDGGTLQPAATRPEHAPVRFIWPLQGNQSLIGLDVWSNEYVRSALEEARDTGQMLLTPPLGPANEQDGQRRVMLALPHYTNGAPRSTIHERREHFVGYAAIVLDMGRFVDGVIASTGSAQVGLSIVLRDTRLAGEDSVLAATSTPLEASGWHLERLPERLVYTRRLGAESRNPLLNNAESVVKAVVTPGANFATAQASGVLPTALAGICVITALAMTLIVLAEARVRTNEDRARLRLAAEQSRAVVADAANRAKSEFLSAMSHEIRTPMNGVLGMVEVLMQTSLRANQMEMARTIRQSALALLATINEILDFSKIEAGRFELELAPARLEGAFEEACVLLGPMALRRQVELTVFIDPDLGALFNSDVGRLRQLVVNLVGNGIKFSSGLSRRGAVHVDARRVQLPSNRLGLALTVRDNGIGIAPDQIAVAFEPFRQLGGSSSRRHEGTGLGLAICKQIIDLMGGTIGIESVVDGGTIVTARIPLETLGARERQSDELRGVRCAISGAADGVKDAVSIYLADAGATIVGDDEPGEVDCSLVDVGLTPPYERAEAALARVCPRAAGSTRPVLVVMRGARRLMRQFGSSRWQIDGTLLLRAQIVEAIATLCGRRVAGAALRTPPLPI